MKKEGLGRWANLLVGVAGAVIGGAFFRLYSDVVRRMTLNTRLLIVYRSRSGLGASFFVSARLAKSRSISSATALSVEKSRFTPSQGYAGSGHLKYPAHGLCHGQVTHSAPYSTRL
jgi:hypothetical protein